jgi:hypothetical protein
MVKSSGSPSPSCATMLPRTTQLSARTTRLTTIRRDEWQRTVGKLAQGRGAAQLGGGVETGGGGMVP